MNIILFVTNISNSLLYFSEDDYKKLSEYLDNLSKLYDSKIFFSICDNTDNKDVIMFFIRKIKKYNDNIFFSYQFLKSTYYRNIIDGAHLYTKDLSKEEKIVKYANLLNRDCNNLYLLYMSKEVNNDILSNLECDYKVITDNAFNELDNLTKKLEI